MIITKTFTEIKTYEITHCVENKKKIKDMLFECERTRLKDFEKYNKCFVCEQKFELEFIPSMAMIKGQFSKPVCNKCAEKISKGE